MTRYLVSVDYQTETSGGTWMGCVKAATEDAAIEEAQSRVRRRRGVMKINGGTVQVSPWQGRFADRQQQGGKNDVHHRARRRSGRRSTTG